MSDCLEDFLNLLNIIFESCDVDGNGYVEIDVLLKSLASQDSRWQGDDFRRIDEECRKLLYCNEGKNAVTKNHFINSFLSWFENTCEEKKLNKELCMVKCNSEQIEKESSLPEAESSKPSCIQFVSDGHILTSEYSLESRPVVESNNSEEQTRLTPLKNELHLLQKKNEILDSTNITLLNQISSLEENLGKCEKVSSEQLKKLEATLVLYKNEKEKRKEAEELLGTAIEENKSIKIQLEQCKKENKKNADFISILKEQMEQLLKEKLEENSKLEETKNRLIKISALYDTSQKDFETLKLTQMAEKETLKLASEENETFKFHLRSNSEQIEDLKKQLRSAHTELEMIHEMIKSKGNHYNKTSDQPWILSDEEILMNKIIPFEKSILAELQNKDVSSHDDDCCKCLTTNTLSSEISISSTKCTSIKCDIAVGTEEVDGSTITIFNENVVTPEEMYPLYCKMCYLKTKRSLKKWTTLGIIILLFCFFLGFFSSLATISYFAKCPQPASMCLSSLLHKFKRPTIYKSVKVPIH